MTPSHFPDSCHQLFIYKHMDTKMIYTKFIENDYAYVHRTCDRRYGQLLIAVNTSPRHKHVSAL